MLSNEIFRVQIPIFPLLIHLLPFFIPSLKPIPHKVNLPEIFGADVEENKQKQRTEETE
jgi:hypothetical protein